MIIRGDGVAAYCCAYLLTKAGFRLDLQPVNRARLPVILLGENALALIRDIFEQPGLLDDAPRIRKRVVAWGPDAKPIMVEHSAVLVSEEALLDAIRPSLIPTRDPAQEADWMICAARPLPAPTVEHRFGTRMASASPVTVKQNSDADACWIESLEDGWLFLAPGWLLSVGAPATTLLGQSRVVAAEIAMSALPMAPSRPTPKFRHPSARPAGWLAERQPWHSIRSAAMGRPTRSAKRSSHRQCIRALANGGSVPDFAIALRCPPDRWVPAPRDAMPAVLLIRRHGLALGSRVGNARSRNPVVQQRHARQTCWFPLSITWLRIGGGSLNSFIAPCQ